MTLHDERQALADALSTVPGVFASPTLPKTIVRGSAWPQFGGMTTNNSGRDWDVNWTIWVSVGQDLRTAESTIDALIPLLCTALERELNLTDIDLAELSVAGAATFVIQIVGRREYING